MQLQELVPGTDFRVHTVGDRVFASEMLSRIGWTIGTSNGKEARADAGDRTFRGSSGALPEVSQEPWVAMSGIDLRRTPEGDYYRFEVNTSPVLPFSRTIRANGSEMPWPICSAQGERSCGMRRGWNRRDMRS